MLFVNLSILQQIQEVLITEDTILNYIILLQATMKLAAYGSDFDFIFLLLNYFQLWAFILIDSTTKVKTLDLKYFASK